jgi:hypothetical protein
MSGILLLLTLLGMAGLSWAQDAPGGETETEKTPGGETEAEKAPGGETEAEKAPGGETEAEGTPAPEVITVPYKVVQRKAKKKSLLVLKPRAIAYKWLFERFRVGSDGVRGTTISPGEDLGLADTQFLSPQINIELSFPVFGMEARLRFAYSDTTLHGVTALGRDIRMSRTLFPAGTIVGSQFTQRKVSLRYFQTIVESSLIDVDLGVGVDYVFFRNVMNSPGFSRQRDVTEAALPVLSVRGFLSLVDGGEAFVRLTGFYWDLGSSTGETGVFECSVGFAVHFSKTWGFQFNLSLAYVSIRKGTKSPVAIDYWEIGPGLAIYASL